MTEKVDKQQPSWLKRVTYWGAVLLIFLFFRYTDQGTVVQGWLQQGLLATGIFQADLRYTEDHETPASYDLSLVSLGGRPAHFEEFRGKTIFMNLWATWCPPCLAEMPYIQSLYDDLESEDVVFVMLSTDEDVDVVRQFIAAKGYTFPVYRVVGRMPDAYRSLTLPTTYVISPQGKLATVHVGMANYNTRGFKSFLRALSDSHEREEA